MRAQVVICVDEQGTVEVLTDGPGVDAFVVKVDRVSLHRSDTPCYRPQTSDTARSFFNNGGEVDSVSEAVPVISPSVVQRLVSAYDSYANGNNKATSKK